jgi:hypothetical protein
MIKEFTEEILTASSWEGGFSLPSPRRRSTGPLPALVTTAPWMENALTTQAMTMDPLQTAAPWPDTDLPSNTTLVREGGKCKPVLGRPTLS